MSKDITVGTFKKLYVASTKNKGNGVFASETIEEGRLIETSIAIIFNEGDAVFIDQTNLYNYYYATDFLNEEEARGVNIKVPSRSGALPLGLVPMSNHSNTPNVEIIKRFINGIVYFDAKALKSIEEDEEITISYKTIWFDVKD